MLLINLNQKIPANIATSHLCGAASSVQSHTFADSAERQFLCQLQTCRSMFVDDVVFASMTKSVYSPSTPVRGFVPVCVVSCSWGDVFQKLGPNVNIFFVPSFAVQVHSTFIWHLGSSHWSHDTSRGPWLRQHPSTWPEGALACACGESFCAATADSGLRHGHRGEVETVIPSFWW